MPICMSDHRFRLTGFCHKIFFGDIIHQIIQIKGLWGPVNYHLPQRCAKTQSTLFWLQFPYKVDHGLLEETGHATPNLWKTRSGPTFVLPNLVLNLGIFRQTFFSRSLEFCLVLREKYFFPPDHTCGPGSHFVGPGRFFAKNG